MNKVILDSVLFVVALGVAMAGLWMVGRGEAAGWMCVGVGAVASVAVPALVKPERRMLVSVMEALLALFVGGGFLCYADRLGATIGLNDYSVFPLLAALWALHELSLWWSGGRWRMAAPGEGRRHTWLVVQLVVAAVLMAGAAVYVAATRTDPVALAYAALCAAMFVGLFRLALVAGRLGAEARRELRVGLFDVALVVFFFYGFAWLYGESWMPLTPIVFHALFLSVMLADVLRWCMEKDSRLDRPWHRLQPQGGGEAGVQ